MSFMSMLIAVVVELMREVALFMVVSVVLLEAARRAAGSLRLPAAVRTVIGGRVVEFHPQVCMRHIRVHCRCQYHHHHHHRTQSITSTHTTALATSIPLPLLRAQSVGHDHGYCIGSVRDIGHCNESVHMHVVVSMCV